MLCSACTELFRGQNTPWYYVKEDNRSVPAYHHHPSPARLAKAAHDGCHICAIVWRKLALDERTVLLNTFGNPYLHRASQAVQRLWGISIAYYSWSPIWWSAEDFGIRFQFGDAPFWKKIVFRLLPSTDEVLIQDEDAGAKFADEVVSSPTSPTWSPGPFRRSDDYQHAHSMWSPHTQRLVQRWYSECIESHDVCRNKDGGHIDDNSRHHHFQPTRILDLSDNRIRLDLDPSNRQGQRYASLTHRWSLKPETMPRLNPETQKEWCQNIDPDILTPTFRDAVDVARKLQIRYLWIDSLCIQQTGAGWEDDWMKEAAVMGEVYRHAFLNIQAGRDAEALSMGLFRAPINRDIEPFKVSISRELVKPRIYGRSTSQPIAIEGKYSIVEEDFARDELLGNPINRRGWVLQERLLSHRITHFGATQVFWECRELLACETFPEGLPKTIPKTMARAATQMVRNPTFDPKTIAQTIKRRMTANNHHHHHHHHHHPTTAMDPKPPAPTITTPIDPRLPVPSFPSLTVHRDLFAWFYLAELYSACSLTRETDKLVAISGLAQIFGSPNFHTRAADVVAYLRNLALPRSGGAVTDLHLDLDAFPAVAEQEEAGGASRITKAPFDSRPGHHSQTSSQTLTSRHAHLGTLPTGDYLAGLWRYELIPCLLWHVANGRQHNGHPSTRLPLDHDSGRAPSWSWASVNGLLHASVYQNWTTGINGVVLAEVSGAETDKSFERNSWGGVRAGRIILTAKCVWAADVKWPSAEDVEELSHVKVRAHLSEVHAGITRRIKLNSASVARQRILRADVLGFVDDMGEFSRALKRAEHAALGWSYQVVLVPLIGLQRRRADWGSTEGYVDEVFEWYGLIVGVARNRGEDTRSGEGRRLGDGVEWVAERLGYFRCRDTDVFKHVLEKRSEVEMVIT